jgi:hypothetical protein
MVRCRYLVVVNRTDEGRFVMSGNPKEYRMYALQCAEMASRERAPQVKAMLLELSANWAKLAVSFEAARELVAEDAALIGVPDHRSRPQSLH